MTIGFHASALADLSRRHEAGDSFLLADLPMPGNDRVDLDLRPVCAMGDGARAQVVAADGSVSSIAPSVRCFSGHLVGGGTAFLAVTSTALNGYFQVGEELFFLSSDPDRPGQATLAHSSQIGTMDAGVCGFGRDALPTFDGIERALAAPVLSTADVFIEADHEFRSRFTSDQECVDYVALLLTAASEVYRRDLGTRLRIPDQYLRVWNTVPPWGVISNYSHLRNVYTWWMSAQNPLQDLPRAAVHVLTSPVFGGTSRGVDGLCNNRRSYEISSLNGRFPYPRLHTDRYNWDLFVLCHEFGHTFGSPHSQLYNPPIECADGSGPDSGTLMSYCHTSFGIAQVGMRFHVREQNQIRAVMGMGCLESQLLELGDYDGDGAIDPKDLSAMDQVLAQGFRSVAAEEVFDMNGDGSLNEFDRAIVSELVFAFPPAQVTPRNGSGINPDCLEAFDNPVLGQDWRSKVFAAGVGSATLLVGYETPLDGVPTARGELLVRTQALGGVKLFTSTAFSDGIVARHVVSLPNDPALYGRLVSFQALVVDGPDGDRYCNALDLILSPNQ